MQHSLFTEPLPLEDSKDFTDEEVARAIPTESGEAFGRLIVELVSPGQASLGKSEARYALLEPVKLLRKGKDYYARAHLGCPNEPDKSLIYQVNWVQNESKQ